MDLGVLRAAVILGEAAAVDLNRPKNPVVCLSDAVYLEVDDRTRPSESLDPR